VRGVVAGRCIGRNSMQHVEYDGSDWDGGFDYEPDFDETDGAFYEDIVSDVQDRAEQRAEELEEYFYGIECGPHIQPLSEEQIAEHEARVRAFVSFYRDFPNQQPKLHVN